MLGTKPATRESLLEMLELPENADLKATVCKDPEKKEIILDLVLEIDKVFDSYEEFKSEMHQLKDMKNRSREDTLAGTEAIV